MDSTVSGIFLAYLPEFSLKSSKDYVVTSQVLVWTKKKKTTFIKKEMCYNHIINNL